MYLRTVVFICECTICLFIGNSVASSITGLSERRDSKTYFSTFHLRGSGLSEILPGIWKYSET
jgi:hypothetical protein